MSDGVNIKVLKDKHELLGDFSRLHQAMEEYGRLLRNEGDREGWQTGALDLLRSHQLSLYQARTSLGSAELALALLHRVLTTLRAERLFLPESTTPQAPAPPAGPAVGKDFPAADGEPDPRTLIAAMQDMVSDAPLDLQEKTRDVLAAILAFLQALAEGQPQQAEEAMARLNLLTTNRQTESLVREIALITRDIYNSLKAVSEGLPLDSLSASSGGLSEAVRRLNSVIGRLESAAVQNLDNLEELGRLAARDEADLGAVNAALRDTQKRLMWLKIEHPGMEGTLTRLQARLSDEVGGPVMTLRHHVQRNVDTYMELISNQSFQELTSRTLKKIIAFVESLEVQLFELLTRFLPMLRPNGEEGESAASLAGETAPPEASAARTQDEVDKLLGDLGF
jgi:chemotaxis regulatin CheY-phosphate phosphatase CheZ